MSMETLRFVDRCKKNGWRQVARELILTMFLTFGSCLWLRDVFGLHIQNAFQLGIVGTWNHIAELFGQTNYIILPRFQVEGQGGSWILLLLCLLVVLDIWCYVHSKNGWSLLVFVGVLASICGILKARCTTETILVLGFGILATAVYIKNDESSSIGIYSVVLAFVIAAVGVRALPGVSTIENRPLSVRQFQKKASEYVKDKYYGENPLHVATGLDANRMESKEDALRITMSMPRSMYLRGFVGDIYRKNHWEALSSNVYYEKRNLMFWLSKEGFEPFGQTGLAKELINGKQQTEQVKIEVMDADTRYAYIPYEMCGMLDEKKARGGNFIATSGLGRLKEYEYSVRENAIQDWTDTSAQVFVKAKEPAVQKYLVSESYYNSYVYEHFTSLSKEEKRQLNKYVGDAGDQSKGHIDYKLAIKGIQDYLEEQFVYTEHLSEKEKSQDEILQGFMESRKGYDVHYATVATLLFRYYGIPARYVEGYLVTPSDAKQMQSNTPYVLKEDRHHAWTEIYVDGFGFVPIEVCPGYRGVMEEADMNVGVSNETLIRPFEQNEDTQGKENLTMAGGDEKSARRSFVQILLISLLLIILAIGILYLFIRLMKLWMRWRKQRNLFYRAEPKYAVSVIYGYMRQKGYPITDEVRVLGERASYSQEEIQEEERKEMIEAWKFAKKEARKKS